MKRSLFAIATLLLATFASVAVAQNLDEKGALPRTTPESVGLDSAVLADTITQLDEKFNRVDGVMILRDGKVVAEAWRAPNGPEIPHALYSLSKSFTSTAVGFAVSEGKLKLDQKVVDFFPDELPVNPDPKLKDVTVRNLLTMSCGHSGDQMPKEMVGTDYGLPPIITDARPTWAEQFLARKIEFEPGEHFVYNTTGTYMCSAIVQKVVGEKIVDYLKPRLFDPLHIDAPYWEESPQGVNKGGTGLFLKTEDIAKFGQLYLQKGKWNGEQILPEAWVEDATAKHVSNGDNPNSDWAQGYGYQFWRCRNDAFRGDGMYSQFCLVMPKLNIVVAVNSDCNNYQGILNVLFDNLIPAAKDAPLPENPDALAKLHEVEKSLQPKEGESGSAVVPLPISSKVLGRDVKCLVYIPNGYLTTSIYFPSLYLLHGLYGAETNWSSPEHGNMKAICDAYYAAHPDQKRVVIMPDGGNLWYRDSADGAVKYETFFFEELIPEIEKRLRVKKDAADRAIAGLSMGGYGSLLYAERRPDVFSRCYAMSAAIPSRENLEAGSAKGYLFIYRGSESQTEENVVRFDEFFQHNDPHTVMDTLSDDAKKSLRVLLDCGDDDGLLEGNYAFFVKARKTGLPCELRVRDGGHTWEYWRGALQGALEFLAN